MRQYRQVLSHPTVSLIAGSRKANFALLPRTAGEAFKFIVVFANDIFRFRALDRYELFPPVSSRVTSLASRVAG
jgi:hypothetical protein